MKQYIRDLTIGFATLFLLAMLMAGCTQNQRAQHWGGTMTVNLEKGQKFVNATWKDGTHLWVVTRPMRTNETAETFDFSEKSNWGLMQGKVIFVEANR